VKFITYFILYLNPGIHNEIMQMWEAITS